MKNLLLMILCLFALNLAGQTAEAKMEEGIQAMLQENYNNAKENFKDGKRIARRGRQKDLKNRMERLEEKAKSYIQFQKSIKSAQNKIRSFSFLAALNDYKTAENLLKVAMAIKVEGLIDHDNNMLESLEDSMEEVEENRVTTLEADLASADQLFADQDYLNAAKAYSSANKNLKRSEDAKYGVSIKWNQCKAWNHLDIGDKYFNDKKYDLALKNYNKSKAAYALPTIGNKIGATKELLCAEIPTDVNAIVDLGEDEVKSLRTKIKKYDCTGGRDKLVEDAFNYHKLIKKAEEAEKTNKSEAVGFYQEAKKLASTEYVTRKVNQLSPKAVLPTITLTQATPMTYAPATRTETVYKKLGAFCPNKQDHRASGDSEFGGGPYADAKLTFTHDDGNVYVDISLNLSEKNNGDTKIQALWRKELVYTSTKKIKGFNVLKHDGSGNKTVSTFVATYTYQSYGKGARRTTMPNGGSEFGICHDGKPYGLTSYIDDSDPNAYEMHPYQTIIKVIGDTGAGDVSGDRDCGCDSKITDLTISGLLVEIEK